jgi:hypothetical protein
MLVMYNCFKCIGFSFHLVIQHECVVIKRLNLQIIDWEFMQQRNFQQNYKTYNKEYVYAIPFVYDSESKPFHMDIGMENKIFRVLVVCHAF